jgi:hypothetical protein
MADEIATRVKSTADILGENPVKEVMQEILADMHPGLTDTKRALAEIFTAQSASEFLTRLTDFENLLKTEDSYETTLEKIQDQIDTAEQMRDQILAQVLAQVRPIESSYRQLLIFFENSKVPDSKLQKPPDLYIFNADAAAIKDVKASTTVASIENFCQERNDSFNFRLAICNLAIPGYLSQPVREKIEDIAKTWGMLLISDTDNEASFRNIERNFLPGGKYEFMKRPEDRAAASVITAGYLELRPSHWFEKGGAGESLYGPASLAFAGALARTDEAVGLAQGPVGSKFGQVAGVDKSRVELLVSQASQLSMERQLVPVIRDANGHLCFFGCRTLAEDPYGVLKFFTSYRVLSHIERRCAHHLLSVAGQVLTREFMDEQIEKPFKRLLEEQVADGTILGYKLSVDMDSNKRMQGICDIEIEVMPTGPAETFVVKLDVPEFKADKKSSTPASG